jgi:excinuclease ABC subunit A
LHFDDVRKLLGVLNRLIDAGNSVVVIEHNLDVIRTSDWIIDLGPAGGPTGGNVLTQGTPAAVAQCPDSDTGRYLAPFFPKQKSTRVKTSNAKQKSK